MKRITQVVALLVVSLALLTTTSVGAQSNGLGISPRKDFTVEPGKTVNDTLYIRNLSISQDLQVGIRIVDFGAANETGTPTLQVKEDLPQTPWSLKPFMKVPASVKIPAGKSANVPVSVTIPANQGAGSYYSAIEYTAQNPETKEKVTIAASSATLVFTTVPGSAHEKLELKQFGTFVSDEKRVNGKFQSFFLGSTPKEFAYRLQNKGNVAEQPSGSLLVKNIFGKTVKEVTDANPKKQLALIDQTRRIQVCMEESVLNDKNEAAQQQPGAKVICDDPGLLPGRYTAQLALYYGLNGSTSQEITATTSFWYLPWWSVILLVLAILLIAFIVWLIRRAFGNRRPASSSKYRR